MVLNVLERSSLRKATPLGPSSSLELPPRLLTLARKTQGRKPDGLGVLGLKQRVSSRQLTQLAFPLMSREHAILESREEELGWQSPMHSPLQSPLHSPDAPGAKAMQAFFALERAQRETGAAAAAAPPNADSTDAGFMGLGFQLPPLPELTWGGFGGAGSSGGSESSSIEMPAALSSGGNLEADATPAGLGSGGLGSCSGGGAPAANP